MHRLSARCLRCGERKVEGQIDQGVSMSGSKRVVGAIAGLLAVLVVAVFVYFLVRDEGPAALELGERAESAESTEAESSTPGEASSDVEGPWVVAADSVAGYRVVEDFAGGVSDFEAVGRTSDVAGSLTIEGTAITQADFTVQVATITSDDGRRDRQFAQSIMRSGDFPEATFVLTEPIELGSIPDDGVTVTAQAVGELTLRGQTVAVEFPIDARRAGAEIETLGSVPVVFADYGIANPSFQLVSVRDEGVVEFSLIFER